MRLLCPAKINLHLRVGPVREDGFHPLLSWFCTTGLFDTLILERLEPPQIPDVGPCAGALADAQAERPLQAEGSRVSLTCDAADLPRDRRNLIVKVAEAFAQEARDVPRTSVGPVRAHLQKRIPAGAGLGGGSSDGAAALLGLNALWNIRWAADHLSGFAARFGSDLPFFFFGPSSVCRGRGEIVRPIARPRPRWALLILPPIAMPTALVYRQFDVMSLGREPDVQIEPDWNAWATLDAQTLLTQLVNDLESPAFAISPDLARLRQAVEQTVGRPVRMSGSGSSLFTLFDEEADARRASQAVEQKHGLRVEAVELAPVFNESLNACAAGR
ncbi:MAG TPA: 4-(cytidine 5'-diphospho)-2-C-methyl-D-erythritol kinase [Tepidisphaeraceae bacterium]|nr:4-(cytidine 5'-diphospho)-2-C-methyl-D-erythritol kinase [Tepidisphaeraceae bacterium]